MPNARNSGWLRRPLVVGDKTFVALHEVVVSKKSENQNDQVKQPQINSTGRPDKGLQDDMALFDLARTYLKIQHRLWPKLVGNLLPEITGAAIESWRRRFEGGS